MGGALQSNIALGDIALGDVASVSFYSNVEVEVSRHDAQ